MLMSGHAFMVTAMFRAKPMRWPLLIAYLPEKVLQDALPEATES